MAKTRQNHEQHLKLVRLGRSAGRQRQAQGPERMQEHCIAKSALALWQSQHYALLTKIATTAAAFAGRETVDEKTHWRDSSGLCWKNLR